MQNSTRRTFGRLMSAGIVYLVVACIGTFAATTAEAKKSKFKKAEGRLLAVNLEEKTILVKVKGKKVLFHAKFEGSVLDKERTTFTMNGRAVKAEKIPLKAPVYVYWSKDPNDPKKRRARKVDAPKIPKELLDELEG